MILRITLPGKPYPQPRIRKGRYGTYYPKGHQERCKKTSSFLNVCATQQHWEKTERPVKVTIITVSKLPIKLNKQCLGSGKRLYKFSRPDIDNYAKYILDRISNAGNIWVDDNQVVILELKDFYGLKDEKPYTNIIIELLNDRGEAL